MSYLGSKAASGAFQAIIASMPPHDVYIETHLGTGAVVQRKPPAARTIVIEKDPDVLSAFRPAYPMELYCGDCVEFLRRFRFAGAGRVHGFMDPPYLHALRTSEKRYRFEYSVEDHEELLALIRVLPMTVQLSGYPSAMYDQALPSWRSIEFQVMTRGGPRTEKLWMNYPGDTAFWASFVGKDHTDRQRIKRKAARWAENYRSLDAGERLAVLAAVLEVEAFVDVDVYGRGAGSIDSDVYDGRAAGSVDVDDYTCRPAQSSTSTRARPVVDVDVDVYEVLAAANGRPGRER